jgi:uncharacterized glyoxalase superfamily protein PhnB
MSTDSPYFIIRRSEQSRVGNKIVTHTEAKAWDVTMIMKDDISTVTTHVLYHYKKVFYLYIEETDQYTFDMLDAIGVRRITSYKIKTVDDAFYEEEMYAVNDRLHADNPE